MSNPFADPNAVWRNGVRVKDIKVQPQQTVSQPPAPNRPKAASGAFTLEDLADCYRIGGVQYRGQAGTYDLSKALLAGGDTKPFADWSSYSASARSRGDFEVPSAPLLHSIIATLYAHRDDAAYRAGIERTRTLLKNVFDHQSIWTLSKAVYAPKGLDRAIHEAGLPTEFGVDETLVGPDEWAKNASAPGAYAALWQDTPAHIQKVYRWVSGKDTNLWRVNAKPKKKADERGVACGGGGFDLDAYYDLGDQCPAFGVRRTKNFLGGVR